MILTKVQISNFRAYQGDHVLELPRPTAGQPIHLIGAPNGTGKTTLFEAIRACLFASSGEPLLRASYLSRGANGSGSTDITVEIEFEYESQQYVLSRHWVPRVGKLPSASDSVALHSLLQNLATGDSSRDEDEIADFIDGLFPSAISHFFLFDGEQIQAYTDSTAASVRDALERLLGLRTYLDLIRDLRNLENQIRRDRQDFDVGAELNRKLERIDVIEARLAAIERNRREVRRDALDAKKQLANLEREASRVAEAVDAELQARRRELENSRKTVQADIITKQNKLAQVIPTELGISLFWPNIIEAYEKVQRAEVKRRIPSTVNELVAFLMKNREAIISALQNEDKSVVKTILCDLLSLDTESEFFEELSSGLEELAELVMRRRHDILSLSRQIYDLGAELTRISHELDTLPSPDSLNVDMQELNRGMSEVRTIQARHEARLGELGAEEKQLQQEREELKNDIDHLSSSRRRFRELTNQIDLTRQLQDALETFVTDYRRTRVEQLEQVINEKFKRLTNLPEILDHIDIDADSYEIQLRLRSSAEIGAVEQSAGQKEVLAFALIASVVELSQRQLPAVIDTPLARLDARHRKNILTRFFPFVGPQVLILATDTEIGREEKMRLQPYVTSEHHLSRDPETGTTSILEGYLIE